MLISHRYKFIFLRTEKTASSSLSKYFGGILKGSDLLYPATPEVRAKLLAEHGSLRNFSFYGASGIVKRHLPKLFGLHVHGTAQDALSFLGHELFDEYKIITSERNPWDRQVSLFSHRMGKHGQKLNMGDFDRCMRSNLYNLLHYNKLNNWEIYSLRGKVCADRVIRFENLEADLMDTLGFLGIDPGNLGFPHRRGQYREGRDTYRSYYTNKSRDIVRRWYKKEIDYFGYEF